MRELELKKSTIKVNGQEVPLSYKELAESCLKQIGKEGINAVQMRKRIKILDKLEVATDKVELSVEQADELKELVKQMPWAVVDKAVCEFCEAVEQM